ncbi:PREDICTED: disease resistance protein RPP13-like [Erythranthe guttata]|uniref:disease resistance protein RPP13-like n=1 Tax=Erythranthe guttata TaxID=4155 RepID=UPI00064DA436|nr:PREDICTED: disease resistance protein RPP13-like [Erythranthe guttata]|eukprot:XP_012842038.1 PREDICTED: disease resistance protein RPP13-like [Erythranthe guttata]
MGSCAALISLNQTLNRISESDDFLSLTDKQCILHEMDSVLDKMEELPSSRIVDAAAYERRVVDALLIFQRLIDSHLSDRDHDEIRFALSLSHQLQIVKQEITSFLTPTDVKEEEEQQQQQQLCSSRRYSNFASSDYSTWNQQQNLLVGLDDQITALKQLIFDPNYYYVVISVVGMTGIGKTSLVQQVYNDPLVIKEFETRLFLHIGPDYTRSEDIVLRVLDELGVIVPSDKLDTDCLQKQLSEALSTQKYLVVLDDVWADLILPDFQENRKKSLIIIISQIQRTYDYIYTQKFIILPFLNDDDSWKLLHQTAFSNREEKCSRELEKIGKKIAKNCEGLPAAIIQVGQNLRGKSFEEWKTLSEKEDPLVITRYDDTPFSKALFFSYMMLHPYLKPFFLYMGVFPKHYAISRSKLIKLWFSEGFLDTQPGIEEIVGHTFDLLIRQSVALREKQASINSIEFKNCRLHFTFRSLCVLDALAICFYEFPHQLLALLQLKYLSITCDRELPNSISTLWNLEGFDLPPPSNDSHLENLITVLGVSVHSCTIEVLSRIPNLKRIAVQIESAHDSTETFNFFGHFASEDKPEWMWISLGEYGSDCFIIESYSAQTAIVCLLRPSVENQPKTRTVPQSGILAAGRLGYRELGIRHSIFKVEVEEGEADGGGDGFGGEKWRRQVRG